MSEEFLPALQSYTPEEGFEGVFTPVPSSDLYGLLAQYARTRQKIEELSSRLLDVEGEIRYFFDNLGETRVHVPTRDLFEPSHAIASLNTEYWNKAIAMTDILECMPAPRRAEWHDMLSRFEAPDFTVDTVEATLRDLLLSREAFFAERVDALFQSLSGEHLTNAPEGFGMRMIIAGVFTDSGMNYRKSAAIADLRTVIARFMGRDAPREHVTNSALTFAHENRRGQWVELDGGALRLRAYKIGTVHLEVHPDVALKLNQILATLHPLVLASSIRAAKAKGRSFRSFKPTGQVLPFAVIDVLAQLEPARLWVFEDGRVKTRTPIPNAVSIPYRDWPEHVKKEAARVLQELGGVEMGPKHSPHYKFDFPPHEVIAEVIASGCIPDRASHNFYPTPAWLAQRAVDWAEIRPGDQVLEPQAGHGGIALLLPKEQTTCVEISAVNCEVLRAQGLPNVKQADFIEWAEQQHRAGIRFDAIVSNPPYSKGRAEHHTRVAASLLARGGRLSAVLPPPVVARLQDSPPPGCTIEAGDVVKDAFMYTSTNVQLVRVSMAEVRISVGDG